MTPICDLKQQNILAMSKYEDTLLTLDEAFCVRRYKYSARLEELRMYQESELIDGMQTVFKIYCQDVIGRFVAMSDTEVYIGPRFYQNYSNMQTNKDGNATFEKHRNKRIGNLSYRTLLRGPITSVDYNNLMFVRVV